MSIALMTRFLRCTTIVTGGEAPEDDRKLGERDLQPWPANEDRSRPAGRGLWSQGLDLGQLTVLKALHEAGEEEPEGFVYRRFRVYDGEDNLIAEGDGIFHTGVEWTWTDPLGFASAQWGAAYIRFFERGKWVDR